MHVLTRSGAQPIDVCHRLLFMRQLAILDVEGAIGEFEEPRVVGHDQDSPAVVFGDAAENAHDRLAVGAVERGGRLIGEDCRRFGNNRAGNSDALLFAASAPGRKRIMK